MNSKLSVVIIILAIIIVIALVTLLVIFVVLPNSYKKQIKNLEKKYSYLDAKLIGQDSQYFKRLEIISRTNLLYLDKYEVFSRRFKAIYDNEDKFCESIIRQLNSLVAAKQFKTINGVIQNAKKAIDMFADSVESFHNDIYEIIKLEEECRKAIDSSKETYRHIKQTYYTESNQIEMVASSFQKTFDKIDGAFTRLDEMIESAEYDEINAKLPELNSVLIALGKVLQELPNLCLLTKTVIVDRINDAQNKFKETEKQGIPLYHLNFKGKVENWKKRLAELNKRIFNLQIYGINAECNLILAEINDLSKQLDEEVESSVYFNSNYKEIYRKVNDVEKVFVKLCATLPQIKDIYSINDEEAKINELSISVSSLSNAKRFLEGFVFSGIKQPYSLLRKQLDELQANYETVADGVYTFQSFINSLKDTAEDAYKMIFIYFERTKEIEMKLRKIGVDNVSASYKEKVEAVYDVLNDIYAQLQSKPIQVMEISKKIEQLKNIANAMFEEVDDKLIACTNAEAAFVKANAFKDQNAGNHSLSSLEIAFNNGDFESIQKQSMAFGIRE